MIAPATRSLAAAKLNDPQALMSIRNLELRARAVVEGFWSGLHRSPYHGFSVEFTEYRQYTPGDDPRYLDWRVYGRTDRYFIKKYEDETNLRCHLLVDQSRSMEFGTRGYHAASVVSITQRARVALERDQPRRTFKARITFSRLHNNHIIDNQRIAVGK